jgi:hypothetical protein
MICFADCSKALNIGRMQICGGAHVPLGILASVMFAVRSCSATRVGACTRAVIHITIFDCVLEMVASPRFRKPRGRNHREWCTWCFA